MSSEGEKPGRYDGVEDHHCTRGRSSLGRIVHARDDAVILKYTEMLFEGGELGKLLHANLMYSREINLNPLVSLSIH